jgi:hypothetical protein
MATNFTLEQRVGPRFVVAIPVRCEWVDSKGREVSVEGVTENVGPDGTLVNISTLPEVGSTLSLTVLDQEQARITVEAEVLRLERNPAQPLAALRLTGETDKWKSQVWELAMAQALGPQPDSDDDEDASNIEKLLG